MSRTISKRMLHKPSNTWYWAEVKLSWNQKYYSFDSGRTWHRSKVAAFKVAENGNQLQRCDSQS